MLLDFGPIVQECQRTRLAGVLSYEPWYTWTTNHDQFPYRYCFGFDHRIGRTT